VVISFVSHTSTSGKRGGRPFRTHGCHDVDVAVLTRVSQQVLAYAAIGAGYDDAHAGAFRRCGNPAGFRLMAMGVF